MSDSEYEEEDKMADEEYAREIEQYTEEWRQAGAEEELRWNLQEAWGKTLPDGMTLLAWEGRNDKYTDVFHTNTLFRELGVRGFGKLRATHEEWQLLMECAHQYTDVYGLKNCQSIMCAMAQWYLKP
jgi:hypothetical protein